MLVTYDPEADAVDVKLCEASGPIRSKRLDEQRIIDYDGEGNVVAVEFLFVSKGIDLDGVPEADRIAAALRSFPTLAPAQPQPS